MNKSSTLLAMSVILMAVSQFASSQAFALDVNELVCGTAGIPDVSATFLDGPSPYNKVAELRDGNAATQRIGFKRGSWDSSYMPCQQQDNVMVCSGIWVTNGLPVTVQFLKGPTAGQFAARFRRIDSGNVVTLPCKHQVAHFW